MLQSIREKTSGWIASIVMGLVILTMAFFGMESYLVPKVETYAAKIEGPAKFLVFGKQVREISQDEFRKRFEEVRQRQRQAMGEAFNAADFEKVENKRRVLEQMIDAELLTLVSDREGLVLPRAAVQKSILAIPSFQVGGKFDKNQYLLALQSENLTPQQFEALMRADLIQRALPSQLAASNFASDAEVSAFLRLSQQTRDIRYMEIPPPPMTDAPPTEAELKAWYDAHPDRYRSEEKVAIEYIELDAANLPVNATPDEQTLRQRYETEKSRFGTPEQHMASHILVKVDEKAPAGVSDAALAKAKQLVAKARAPGADFAALARENSDDVGSKDTGGDLGPIEKGVFGDAFDKAFFALQPGQVSDPVRMPDGWHVLLYRELKPGTIKPFEQVRGELETQYQESERERVFNDISGQLVDKIYADPSTLAPVAKELNLPIQRTGLFTHTQGEGIAALEPVRKAAFNDAQKIERLVSDPVEIDPSHLVALHVLDYQPVVVLPFAQVRDRVMAEVLGERVNKASKIRADALLARAQKGETLDALAAEVGGTVTEMKKITRIASSPETAPLINEAFRIVPPAAGKTGVGMATIGSNHYVLFNVVAVVDGDIEATPPASRARLREQLAAARGAVDAKAFTQALRKRYTVTVAEDRL